MGRSNPELRDAVLTYLRKHHPAICRGWFNDLDVVDLDGGVLKILVREPVQLRYLRHTCVDQFTEAARAVTGHLLVVRFIGEVDAQSAEVEAERLNGDEDTFSPEDEMLISPDYSFVNFVVGPGNQLAHAGALAVAQQPGRAYNPFFIHSGVGLGKTHLLHAICQETMRADPAKRILYLSCNAFMSYFVHAVQHGRMNEFRHCFRNVDMLVIDDIHDLSKRGQTQEEFFHTFNSLYQTGRQIVLSSDAAPNQIPDLEERLTSRFNCGLVASIEKPCYETRVAITHSKATLRGLDLPDDVACLIAAHIDTNIREIEGAITKIHSIATYRNAAIDALLAGEVLGVRNNGRGAIAAQSMQAIIEAVATFYNLKVQDLMSRRRNKSIVMPRQIAMWLARKHTKHSLEEIGAYIGGRDHTTVLHAVRTINNKREANHTLNGELMHLDQSLSTPLINMNTA